MTNDELITAIRTEAGESSDLIMELWNQNSGMIRKACGKFAGRLEPEDARQECYFAFTDAVKEYDPEAGAAFGTYLYNRCVWHLSRYVATCGGLIRIPEDRRRMIRQYLEFVRQWFQEKGLPPDSRTIYFALGLDRDQVQQLRADMQALNISSLDIPLSDDPDGATVADIVQDKAADVEAAATDPVFIQERRRAVWSAVDSLKEKDREAIKAYYREGLTYQQTAALEGVSAERIRARLVRGLQELRKPKYKELREFVDLSPIYSRAIQGGAESFNRTWTSATEKTALWILEAEERWRQEREELDRMLERNRREREEYDRRKERLNHG